jgi:predicted AAA+ superfamily ATPase
MTLTNRKLKSKIKDELLHSNKVIIIFGARQVGKTTLIKQIISESNLSHISVNGEEAEVGAVFNQLSYDRMMEVVGNSSILFVDEAQNIEHIGKAIKILYDKNPDLKIVI